MQAFTNHPPRDRAIDARRVFFAIRDLAARRELLSSGCVNTYSARACSSKLLLPYRLQGWHKAPDKEIASLCTTGSPAAGFFCAKNDRFEGGWNKRMTVGWREVLKGSFLLLGVFGVRLYSFSRNWRNRSYCQLFAVMRWRSHTVFKWRVQHASKYIILSLEKRALMLSIEFHALFP